MEICSSDLSLRSISLSFIFSSLSCSLRMVCLVLVTSRLNFSTSVSSCCRVTSAASHFSQMLELSGDTAEIQPGVVAGVATSFLVFGLTATLLRLSAILSWSLSLSPVLEEDSGGEVEDEVEVLAGIEENPLSLLRFALFSLFDPRRTANVE